MTTRDEITRIRALTDAGVDISILTEGPTQKEFEARTLTCIRCKAEYKEEPGLRMAGVNAEIGTPLRMRSLYLCQGWCPKCARERWDEDYSERSDFVERPF